MKAEDLLRAVGAADVEYLEQMERKPQKRPHRVLRFCAAAACFALMAAGVWMLKSVLSDPRVDTEDPSAGLDAAAGQAQNSGGEDAGDKLAPGDESLPRLTVDWESGSMGFEGVLLYDAVELERGNPWTQDAQPECLPVYENTSYVNSAGLISPGIGEQAMHEIAQAAADALGQTITGYELATLGEQIGTNDTQAYRLKAWSDEIKLSVTADGTLTIEFLQPVSLPEQLHFTRETSSREEAEQAMDYLMQRYGTLVDFAQPAYDLFADYTYAGEQNRGYRAYDAAGTLAEQMVNYSVSWIAFYPNEEGQLYLIRCAGGLRCAQKLGDYPLITAAEARERLLSGNYLSSCPDGFPGEAFIARVELVYRTGAGEQTWMPYYCFWVELPEMERENGLRTYGAFYVPAVQDRYLDSLPLWDGSMG